MTYDLDIKKYRYKKENFCNYKSVFNVVEYTKVVNIIKKVYKKDFINEKCVRLNKCNFDAIDDLINLSISRLDFYDFLLSTYLIQNFEYIYNNCISEERVLIEKVKSIDVINITTLNGLLDCEYLSNILAVSLILLDKNNNSLLVFRNNNNGISDGFLSTTVTGSLDEVDYNSDDPIINCAKRELKEELNYDIQSDNLVFSKIVCGYKKKQPVAIVNGYVDDIDNVICNFNNEFNIENRDYIKCKKDELTNFLNNKAYSMTEACESHLLGVYNGSLI